MCMKKQDIVNAKRMHRIYKFGAFLRLIRSTVFNLLIFFIGISIGMGFTMINARTAWKERYDADTLLKLERVLQKHNIENTEIRHIILQLRDKRIEINTLDECPHAKSRKKS